MRRILAILLILTVLFGVCACSGSENQNVNSGDSNQIIAGDTDSSKDDTDLPEDDADTPEDDKDSSEDNEEVPDDSADGCKHKWEKATCTDPTTCTVCGKTVGAAKGHSWQDATCAAPKTCARCGATEGAALNHNWDKATCATPKTCKVCGATEGTAAGHSWNTTTGAYKTCTVCGYTEGFGGKLTNIILQLGQDESQMNFTWFSESNANGVVTFAKASELVNGKFPANAKKVNATRTDSVKDGFYGNKATITGLLPGTTYAYQLTNGSDKTEIKQFTTVASKTSFSFAFAGDAQIGRGYGSDESKNVSCIASDGVAFGRTLSQMMKSTQFKGVNFFMSAGDQINSYLNSYKNHELMWDAYSNHEEFLGMPMVTVLGNHDSYPYSVYPYHVNQPNMLTKANGSYYGATYDGNGNYLQSADYYFTYNNVLFLVLNTNTFTAKSDSSTDTAADKAAAEDHIAFIDRVLEETKGQKFDWTIVLYHQSPYGSSYHNNNTTNEAGMYNRTEQYAYINMRKFLVPKLYEVGVDLILSGHDHCYTRTHILKPATDKNGNYTADSVIDSKSCEYVDGKPVKATNPDGILHITAATSSGTQVNGVEYTSEYTAVTATAKTRHLSRIDISEKELTIVTYNMGTQTEDSITEVDRFTIVHTN